MTQKEFILSYYKSRPTREIENSEVEDWARANANTYGFKMRNPGRTIRTLHEEGELIQVSRGKYKLK